jgi:hypothetical protein
LTQSLIVNSLAYQQAIQAPGGATVNHQKVMTGKFNKLEGNVSPKDAENHQNRASDGGNGTKLTHLTGICRPGVAAIQLIAIPLALR